MLSTLALFALMGSIAAEGQPAKPFAGISFRAVPDATKIQIELHTKGENSYRVTFTVEGKKNTEVRDRVAKELSRRHWDVEAKGNGLVMVYGFKPAEGETEPITAITVTMYASDPRVPPPFPGIGHGESVRSKVLIQMLPGPNLEEKP
jgi:hypothetical protein